MFWEDDVAGFFVDFGEPAILKDGREITILFDSPFFNVTAMGIDIEASKPTAVAKSADVLETVHGDTLKYKSVTYTIIGVQPDGTGITVLILSE